MTPWQARRLRRLLALWGPLVAISVTSVVVALLLWRHLETTSSPGERFYRAWSNDDNRTAEELAWKMVRGNPGRLNWWVRFTDAHADVIAGDEGSSIGEPEIRQQLAKISDTQASAIESYFYAVRMHSGEPDSSKVLPLADASPPEPYANFVLGEGALAKKDWRTAAMRFERESSSSSDVDETCLRRALRVRIRHDDWAAVRARINDPRWAAVVDTSLRLELAVHDRDVLRVLLWVWPACYVQTTAWPVALAVIAGDIVVLDRHPAGPDS